MPEIFPENHIQLGKKPSDRPSLQVHIDRENGANVLLIQQVTQDGVLVDHTGWTFTFYIDANVMSPLNEAADIVLTEGNGLTVAPAPDALRMTLTDAQIDKLSANRKSACQLKIEGVFNNPWWVLNEFNSYIQVNNRISR